MMQNKNAKSSNFSVNDLILYLDVLAKNVERFASKLS
jgi:hypothetical protein